ncbi:MAG TPA: tetratricopeptide repeat protein [Ardenticatenaceae bacterium]|nr:tetratricopeptide repeat protein [Ardenticatenaceae bacterium]
MATLAHASSEFVRALQRGLEAYDAGDRERAYAEFSQALEIEPENIWGLLWKGATAPTPAEAATWLGQALALDPTNEHARAGLAWAQSYIDPGASTGGPDRAGHPTDPLADAIGAEPAGATVLDHREPADMVGSAATGVGDDDGSLAWLDTGTQAEDHQPERNLEPAAPVVDEEELPDWLRDSGSGDETGALRWSGATGAISPRGGPPDAGSASDPMFEDLPDWLTEEGVSTETAGATGELAAPSWLRTQQPTGGRSTTEAGSAMAEAYEAGLLAYEENRLDEAARYFEQAIRLDPNRVEAHNYLGSVYFLQGRTDEAVRAFSEALRLDPNHADSHLNLGLVYQDTNQSERAIQMFERYLELEPESAIAVEVEGFLRTLRGS